MYLKVAEALRTAREMTDSLSRRFVFVENPNGMSGKQLIPISSPQIQILLVQRPFGTYNHITFDGKYHGTACFISTWKFIEVAEALRTVTLEGHKSVQTHSRQQILLAGL